MKIGISKLSGVYTYNSKNIKICKVDVSCYIPSAGLGVEKKFNQKWGASAEAIMDFKKKVKGFYDLIEHETTIKPFDMRLMATYSIRNK